jgi:hypothetical protein
MQQLIGRNRKGNALLCYFTGETDCPVAFFASDNDTLRRVIVDSYTGDPESPETEELFNRIAEHDFYEYPMLRIEFEIGYASFEDVLTYCLNGENTNDKCI